MADFGLAKVTTTYCGIAWAMKTFCGTEAFMAPEHFAIQDRGAGQYDKSVDIFALGLVILSILTTEPGYILEALEGLSWWGYYILYRRCVNVGYCILETLEGVS